MSKFVEWFNTSSGWGPWHGQYSEQHLAKAAYLAGLRRAAEIAREDGGCYEGVYNCGGGIRIGESIESEAKQIEEGN